MSGTRSEASVTSTFIAPFVPAGTIGALEMMIAFRERDRDEVHGTRRSPRTDTGHRHGFHASKYHRAMSSVDLQI